MSRARDADQAKADHIRTLRIIAFGLFLFVVVLIGLLFYALRVQTLFVPPDLTEGGRLTTGKIPKVIVYEFGEKLWKKINLWESDGQQEYKENLHLYQHYLTPECSSFLNREYHRALAKGELQKRTRELSPTATFSFSPTAVESQGAGVWHVTLELNLVETVRDTPVKDLTLRYPLRIVTQDIDQDLNPWGLAIDCFYQEPSRLKNNLGASQ